MTTDYERGFEDAKALALAVAEKRLDGKSVLKNVLPVLDDLSGEDWTTEHQWFCKGRRSSAQNIVDEIKQIRPKIPSST